MMARLGYKSFNGNKSKGSRNNKKDHYTIRNINMVAEAIQNLKNHYNSEKVILVGHSGGAVTIGIMIGKHPGLIDSAISIACPCNIPQWYKNWTKSSSPHLCIKKIEKKIKVRVIVGEHDKNTYPSLSEQHFKLLEKNEIKSELLIINATHSFEYIFNNKEAIELGKKLVN